MAARGFGSLAGLALALGLVAAPNAALACRELQYPATIDVAADVIVVARVGQSGFYGDQSRFWSWQAFGLVTRTLKGKAENPLISFTGSTMSSGCPKDAAKPAVGEEWVVYARMTDGLQYSVDAVPLAVARRLDPRVAAAGL